MSEQITLSIALHLTIHHRQPCAAAYFDPDEVVRRLKERFPHAQVDGEAFQRQLLDIGIQQVKKYVPDEQEQAKLIQQKQAEYELLGPRYTFEIPVAGGESVRGSVQRVSCNVVFDSKTPDPLQQRLRHFLETLQQEHPQLLE